MLTTQQRKKASEHWSNSKEVLRSHTHTHKQTNLVVANRVGIHSAGNGAASINLRHHVSLAMNLAMFSDGGVGKVVHADASLAKGATGTARVDLTK